MCFGGKVTIVTGGGRGIGREIASRLLAEGGSVVIADIEFHNQPSAGCTDRLTQHEIDLEQTEAIPELIAHTLERFGRIDVVVNNAGVEFGGTFFEVTRDVWDRHLNINLRAMFFTSQHAASWMKDHGGGAIVNIASVQGTIFSPRYIPYTVSKAGVRGLTGAMAVALAPYGIRVNAVAPGWTDTAMNKLAPSDPAAFEERMRLIPLRRIGQPADIAEAVLYLASPSAAYVTGQTLTVDGGRTLGAPVR
jgi:NAD(P)-dependent dehydrogenase (short-subunit alcohol dehydrogenase family)